MRLCVSRLIACDRNYDWRQRKTQLWRQLLNFRVRMFVKSAVKDVLSRTHVNGNCAFCIRRLGQYSAEQYIWCPNFRERRSIRTISNRNLTCVERLCLSSLLKEETKRQCWTKIKKKENGRSAPGHNTIMGMVRKDVRNFALAVKQCWSRDIN